MKYRNLFFKIITFILVAALILPVVGTKAEDNVVLNKKYIIIIANSKGSYTFYDMNDSTVSKEVIETTEDGYIMVPLKKLVNLLPGFTYQYDSSKKKATVVNTNNGKKIIYTRNSKILYYYSGSKAKASKKTLENIVYVSKESSSLMVPISSIRLLFETVKGYQFYSTADMQKTGYDTMIYNGLIQYNPYKAVTELPKAANVTGISATVKVTIPEGYSVTQTFDLLVKKGVCASIDALYEAMANYDFTKYPLVSEIPQNENRCFKLEGYLFPDTYEFYRLSKGENVIGKFLSNTEVRITEEDREKAETMGYSVDEILTIASLIEKETGDHDLMPTIASVIYNRLNIGMKIQFDSSIFYVERYIKPYISGDKDRYNSYYNTYKCRALPAGPICNPGKAAIKAALNPQDTDYYYFYSDSEGEYHFSHAAPTLTPKPTVTLSPTPSISPTITPAPATDTTISPIPTISPTITPTPSISSTITPTPTVSPT